MKSHFLFFILFLTLLSCRSPENKAKNTAPLFANIGNYHHSIATQAPLAQQYFDQALTLFYSFEYGESIRSFRAAIQADPKCAMCYWGLALALGSKTDMPMSGQELEEAKASIQTAGQLTSPLYPAERAYIAALTQRYTNMPPQKLAEAAGLCSSYSLVGRDQTKNYAEAMRNLVALFPDDTDAKVLYAAALFDAAKWNFWTHQHQSRSPYTLTVQKTLETAMHADKDHPGANHLYVHFIEASPYPQRALHNAERLNELVPVSQHMTHMPCHTYFSLGRYHDAAIMNQQAITVYQDYVKTCRVQGFKPEVQYLYFHDMDYLISMASMEGRKKLALSTANDFEMQIKPFVKNNIYMQKALTSNILVLTRFGEWNEILRLPAPDANDQYVVGIWHYARAIAEIELNQLSAARADLLQLEKITQQGDVPKNMGKFGHTLLTVAVNVLHGIMANKTGQVKQAIFYLNKAIQIQDGIYAADPPPWYFPVRQLLGAVLLQHARPLEAEKVFAADLKMYPHNGWSLFGLMQSEQALGYRAKAQQVQQEFLKAWQYADNKEPVYPL